jgi:translocator protein
MSLALFMLVTVGGGLLIGFVTRPDEWYSKLAKPWFTPPNNIFAPAWTVLYVLIAIAGWRTFTRDAQSAAMIVWTIALILNFVWSPIFFGVHRPTAALAVILALLANILVFIFVSWPQDSMTALLFAPYAVWVAFATVLNAEICRLNRFA